MTSSLTETREKLMISMVKRDLREVLEQEAWTISSACLWVDKEEDNQRSLK
jgi:hypothetical protein